MLPHNTGRKYVNNGTEKFWINKDQIDYYQSLGFKLGRLPNVYKKHSNNTLEEDI